MRVSLLGELHILDLGTKVAFYMIYVSDQHACACECVSV